MIKSIDGDVIHDEFRGLAANEITARSNCMMMNHFRIRISAILFNVKL